MDWGENNPFTILFQGRQELDLQLRGRAVFHPFLEERQSLPEIHQQPRGQGPQPNEAVLSRPGGQEQVPLFHEDLPRLVSENSLSVEYLVLSHKAFFTIAFFPRRLYNTTYQIDPNMESNQGHCIVLNEQKRFLMETSFEKEQNSSDVNSDSSMPCRYPCGLKYCKNKEGEGEHRCGIKTCRKCQVYKFPAKSKVYCLWDNVWKSCHKCENSSCQSRMKKNNQKQWVNPTSSKRLISVEDVYAN